jgi:hypothetical protein
MTRTRETQIPHPRLTRAEELAHEASLHSQNGNQQPIVHGILAEHSPEPDKLELVRIKKPASQRAFSLPQLFIDPDKGGNMVQLCTHVRRNGKTCASPALHNQAHCYFHGRERRPARTRRRTIRPGYRWYGFSRRVPLMTEEEIMPAFREVIAADLAGQITPHRAMQLYNRLSLRGRQLHPETCQ